MIYYIATKQHQMQNVGDIILAYTERDSDGTPADNLTQGFYFCPFNFMDVTEISKEEALKILNDQKR